MMKTYKQATLIALTLIATLAHAKAPNELPAAGLSLQPGMGHQNGKQISEPPPVADNSTIRGKLLYDNHCRVCHDSTVHIRNQRKAASIVDISYWVTRWRAHLKLTWSDEDIDDVVEYLNSEYYHFKDSSITK